MKVCVFGATGATGLLVTKMLLDKGHEVTAYVRNQNKISFKHELLKVVQGELHDVDKVADSLQGIETVVSCLGSNTTKKSIQLETMAINIGKAMKKAGVERIIYMATAGIEDEFSGLFKFFIRILLGNVIDDHKKASEFYKSQGFNYTIVRPLQLKDGIPSGIYQEAFKGLPKSKKAISRGNVAMLIVKAVEDSAYHRTSVSLSE